MSPAAPASSRLAIGFACGILAAAIWGVQAVVSRQSVADGLSAGDVTILRFLAAALVLLPFAIRRLKPFPVGRLGWKKALILTAIVGPSYSLILVGGAHFAPALHSSVISPGLIPVATALLAVLVLGERISRLRVIGLSIIVAGIVVFSFEAIANTPTREGAWIGDLLFVLIALLWSVFGLLARRWGRTRSRSPWRPACSRCRCCRCSRWCSRSTCSRCRCRRWRCRRSIRACWSARSRCFSTRRRSRSWVPPAPRCSCRWSRWRRRCPAPPSSASAPRAWRSPACCWPSPAWWWR